MQVAPGVLLKSTALSPPTTCSLEAKLSRNITHSVTVILSFLRFNAEQRKKNVIFAGSLRNRSLTTC